MLKVGGSGCPSGRPRATLPELVVSTIGPEGPLTFHILTGCTGLSFTIYYDIFMRPENTFLVY